MANTSPAAATAVTDRARAASSDVHWPVPQASSSTFAPIGRSSALASKPLQLLTHRIGSVVLGRAGPVVGNLLRQ
jgi:hypothetical protein